MAEGEDAQPGLSKLFLLGWKAKSKLDAFELSTGTPEHSSCVAGGISALERATQLASHVSLLSDNEDLDELPTSSLKWGILASSFSSSILLSSPSLSSSSILLLLLIVCRYLLLPALLGELTLQQTTGERTAIIGKARVYYNPIHSTRHDNNYCVRDKFPYYCLGLFCGFPEKMPKLRSHKGGPPANGTPDVGPLGGWSLQGVVEEEDL